MLNDSWKNVSKIKEHNLAKNKNLKAIYLTKENVDKIQKETDCFSVFSEGSLLTGFMSFQSYPVWMICINPKSKVNKFIFESDKVFNLYFKIKDEVTE